MPRGERPTFREWLLGRGYQPDTMSVSSRMELFPVYQVAMKTPPDKPATYAQTYMDVAPKMWKDAASYTFESLGTMASSVFKGIWDSLGITGLAAIAGVALIVYYRR